MIVKREMNEDVYMNVWLDGVWGGYLRTNKIFIDLGVEEFKVMYCEKTLTLAVQAPILTEWNFHWEWVTTKGMHEICKIWQN